MMPTSNRRRYSPSQIYELRGRGVFIDTNVLLMIFRKNKYNHPRGDKYFEIFTKILAHRLKIFVNEISLSEFYYAALKVERDKSNFPSIKEFRDSEAGIQAREEIFSDMRTMLHRVQYIPSNLPQSEIMNLFTADSLDFNDKLIAATCRKDNYVLVTDDADYMDTDIEILSANSTMFA